MYARFAKQTIVRQSDPARCAVRSTPCVTARRGWRLDRPNVSVPMGFGASQTLPLRFPNPEPQSISHSKSACILHFACFPLLSPFGTLWGRRSAGFRTVAQIMRCRARAPAGSRWSWHIIHKQRTKGKPRGSFFCYFTHKQGYLTSLPRRSIMGETKGGAIPWTRRN